MIACASAPAQDLPIDRREQAPVVQRYRVFFACLDWSVIPERDPRRPWPGSPPHPRAAYVKALLSKLCEQKV